ncbi:uncharacterized protein LOC110445128 [Mizuhopecten yessoensis]|uniref:Uncharacterized protein n=1 Tax=Mizuhopecten yessoensis TaxID=6573 RepID=A0A210R084_MIZYE|nr:uncharacterized protein LOC110445128 [Mizuhopecten yessoensis]OWF54420.1 hypothetical protein KP79_PYT08636 [Mizuhopecten yessoensis]
MTYLDEFEAIVHEMCVDVTREAIAEIDAENMKDKTAEHSPEQLLVLGHRKLHLPRLCLGPANRTEIFPSKWRQFLASPKTCCDISTLHMRDVSMTKSWVQCSPELEDQELRQKHKERVNSWRNLLITDKNEPYLPGVFRYKATKSLLDHICPIMKMKLNNFFEIVDLKDIIPKIIIDSCEDVVDITSKGNWKEVSKNPLGDIINKQRWNGFLCCFQR